MEISSRMIIAKNLSYSLFLFKEETLASGQYLEVNNFSALLIRISCLKGNQFGASNLLLTTLIFHAGMVDPGETVSTTVRREFMEEAMDSTGEMQGNTEDMEKMVTDFFANGKEIYSGYVDDPRNTDNAWMETVAFLFHDETGDTIGKFNLKAGDDAKALKWADISQDLELYASHSDFVREAVQELGAHW